MTALPYEQLEHTSSETSNRLQSCSLLGYTKSMIEVRQDQEFSRWVRRLRDANAVARIVARIRQMELGNLGDSKSLRGGLMEMQIDYGPGYRVYYVRRGAEIVILLCAGDKRTQQRDIKRARELAERL